jgi:EAL domain-containing protein (putative c-di-GMP-specific phosphodiesterase class I)
MWPQARVAVNVSSRQLIDSFFVARIKALLIEYRLPPRCIEIELTETVLQTGAATLEALRQLRAHGIAIALDDFGTGYSSLASLQQLPLTRIKLDRSLVNDIDTSPRAFAIAHSIISLAKSLELEVTAEGIERQGQLALLTGERPLVVQGFLFSRPLSETELIGALPKLNQRSRELLAGSTESDTQRHRRAPRPGGAVSGAKSNRDTVAASTSVVTTVACQPPLNADHGAAE